MKKIIFFTLLLFTSIFNATSQTYEVDWGPSYKKDGGLFGYYSLIGIYEDHYYILMNPKRKNTLLKYDMNHKLVSNKILDMKYNRENININRFLHTQKGTFGYLRTYDKKQKKQKIFISEFKEGNFSKIKEIYSHPYNVKFKLSLWGFTNYTNFDASTLLESADGSHVLYTSINSSTDSKNKEEISVVVFDADMNISWKKTQRFKYQDKKITIEQAVVGNNGDVYILAKVWEKKKNKRERGLPRYDFKAFKITETGMKEYEVDLGNGIAPTDAGIYFPDNNQEFILAGFYTNAVRSSGVKGVFYAAGNSDTGIKNIKTHEFEASFLKGLIKQKSIEKDKGLQYTFSIQDFIAFNDGSISFLAEENYVVTRTYTDGQGNRRTSHTYHTNEIIIPRFSNNGALINIQKIEKSFSSSSPLNASYTMALHNDKTYLLFNDYKQKKELKAMKGKKKRKWRYTDLVIIDEKGNIAHNETLFNSDEIDLEFTPFMSDYYDNTLLLGSMRIKKYAFGTLKLD